jgi:hypothetical protein
MAYKGGKWRTVTKGSFGVGVDNQGGTDDVTVTGKKVRRRRLGGGFVDKFVAKGEGLTIRDRKVTTRHGTVKKNKKSTNYRGYKPGA